MLKSLLIFTSFLFCLIGCGVDTPLAPDTEIETVPAAPSAVNGLYDITKFAFTTFEKEEVIGEMIETHTYHLRVYQHKDALGDGPLIKNKDKQIILYPNSGSDPTTWEISFASKVWTNDWSVNLIESAVVKKVAPMIFNDEPYETFKVYANKTDYRKAKKRYKRFQNWQAEQRQALINAGIIRE